MREGGRFGDDLSIAEQAQGAGGFFTAHCIEHDRCPSTGEVGGEVEPRGADIDHLDAFGKLVLRLQNFNGIRPETIVRAQSTLPTPRTRMGFISVIG